MQHLDDRDEQDATPVLARVPGLRPPELTPAEGGDRFGRFAKAMVDHASAAAHNASEYGTDLSISLESGQQNDNHCPERRRRNTVRGSTSKAQIDPKLLQHSATDERAD